MKKISAPVALGLAYPFMVMAVFFGFTQVEDEEAVELPPYLLRMKADEQRRIDTIHDNTFTPDGHWIYEDPNHDARYTEQMKILGWRK